MWYPLFAHDAPSRVGECKCGNSFGGEPLRLYRGEYVCYRCSRTDKKCPRRARTPDSTTRSCLGGRGHEGECCASMRRDKWTRVAVPFSDLRRRA